MTGARCAAHPKRSVTALCRRCGDGVCAGCVLGLEGSLCPRCEERELDRLGAHRMARMGRVARGLGLAAPLIAALLFEGIRSWRPAMSSASASGSGLVPGFVLGLLGALIVGYQHALARRALGFWMAESRASLLTYRTLRSLAFEADPSSLEGSADMEAARAQLLSRPMPGLWVGSGKGRDSGSKALFFAGVIVLMLAMVFLGLAWLLDDPGAWRVLGLAGLVGVALGGGLAAAAFGVLLRSDEPGPGDGVEGGGAIDGA